MPVKDDIDSPHNRRPLVDRHRRRTGALVALGGHDLVVVATQVLRKKEREKGQLAFLSFGTDTAESKGRSMHASCTYQTKAGPGINVVLESDGAASPVLGADGNVLRERSSALDGWGVGAGRLVDVVGAAV